MGCFRSFVSLRRIGLDVGVGGLFEFGLSGA